MDLAVKWRFFRHLDCQADDPDSERVYRWHIDQRRRANLSVRLGMDSGKRDSADYVAGAICLKFWMRRDGFDPLFPIPVGRDGEILGGAHRLACALALGIDAYVQYLPQAAWAPAWGRQWFVDNGMSEEDLARTLSDWDEMCRPSN